MTNEFDKRLAQDFAHAAVRHDEIDEAEEGKYERNDAYDERFDRDVPATIARNAVVPKAHQELLTMRMRNELFTRQKHNKTQQKIKKS